MRFKAKMFDLVHNIYFMMDLPRPFPPECLILLA